MSKPVILTGLRANNDLHLGNYLGALLPMVQLQKKYAGEYQINLFVPDLHSFTTPINHSKLYAQSMQNSKLFVAAGLDLDNPDTFIYRQSYIPAHSELTVILNCFTYMGELNRMTQFKEKGEGQGNISAGLFDYPVLMAADILLYGAKYVPVGADQTQHVELARDIAIRMNNKFGDLFTPPESEKEQIAFIARQERLRIRDLANPEKKMSKSDDSGKGVIFLGDSPEAAAKKIMSATTDSFAEIKYDHQERPGISNLLDILAALSNQPLKEVIAQYEGQNQYGPLKTAVADEVKKFLNDFQQSLTEVDEAKLASKLASSEAAMNTVAQSTLLKVQTAVGLRA
jgi:tryptophanyl-tRNA synthetase